MKVIVAPGNGGVVSAAGQILGQPVPEGALLVEVETLDLPPNSAARIKPGSVHGAIAALEIIPNWIGSGPWFDPAAPAPLNHRLSLHSVNVSELSGTAIDRLTAIEIDLLGIDPQARGWQMEPRPETQAEKRAREKRDTDAAAARDAERKANRIVSAVQIRLAANELGLRDAIEAVVADPATPRTFRDYWEYSTEFRRNSPLWPQALALIGRNEAVLDQLFDLAEG